MKSVKIIPSNDTEYHRHCTCVDDKSIELGCKAETDTDDYSTYRPANKGMKK